MGFVESKTQSMAPDGRRGGLVVGLRRTSTGEVYTLDAEPRRWMIGSEDSCDFQIDDPYVSGTHCVIERRPNGTLVVRDRNSRNGTFVDGNPIEGAELRVGSYLSIGRTTLVALAGMGNSSRQHAIELLRGRDPALRRSVEQSLRAAQSDCSILILGETGTGKDLLARVIHEGSRRNDGPFVAVNCGAIPRELIASELFGHEKGAFTGATDGRDGFFVEAQGGTLFLDEIGELPIELQAHLLRVLETRRVRRVGGSSERVVNVRIVAATNRTEGLGSESGRLRQDLYHRLATIVVGLPPLRERMGDLPELVDAILDELSPDFGRKELIDASWIALNRYSWPGNVRELRQAVARAVTLGADVLEPQDFFPDGIGPRPRPESTIPPEDDPTLSPYESMIRAAMVEALAHHGTIRAAALSLGIPKSTFGDRAKQWNLLTPKRVRRRVGTPTPSLSTAVAPELLETRVAAPPVDRVTQDQDDEGDQPAEDVDASLLPTTTSGAVDGAAYEELEPDEDERDDGEGDEDGDPTVSVGKVAF
jgi:DNA-binding NtrC family response regulator